MSSESHQNNLCVLLDLFHELLETLLKLASVFGASHKETHVQSYDLCQELTSVYLLEPLTIASVSSKKACEDTLAAFQPGLRLEWLDYDKIMVWPFL